MNTIITVSGLGVLVMIVEIFRLKKILPFIVIPGIIAAMAINLMDWNFNTRYFNDMIFSDNYAIAFSGVLLGIALLWFFMSVGYFKNLTSQADQYAIVLFSLAGALIMVSYADLSMLFIGLEILSISFYILASSTKTDLRSNEAGFKYFILGAFATGFLLFGIALIYGASGTFNLQKLASYVIENNSQLPGIFYAGILLILIGLGFKVSAVPFHSWAPDVYEGSPTLITALMATMVKTAAFAALYRLFATCFVPASGYWSEIIWILAAASMLTGNIMALSQKSLKRMLAYSSIAHAGYMLLAVVAINAVSASALLLYTAAYAVASITSFAILYQVSRETKDESIAGMHGFAKAHPYQALLLIIALLSMAGIPPLAGFFAKYYLFYSALQSGYTALILLAVLSSLIGVFYYLRVIVTLFQHRDGQKPAISFSPEQTVLLTITGILTLLIGLVPNLFTDLLK